MRNERTFTANSNPSARRRIIAATLITLLAIIYGVISPLHDIGDSHLENSLWPGHARMHLAWLLIHNLLIAALAIGLAWWPGRRQTQRQLFAATISMLPFLSFVAASLLIPLFGGTFSDGSAEDVREAADNVRSFSMVLPISLVLFVWCWRGALKSEG